MAYEWVGNVHCMGYKYVGCVVCVGRVNCIGCIGCKCLGYVRVGPSIICYEDSGWVVDASFIL